MVFINNPLSESAQILLDKLMLACLSENNFKAGFGILTTPVFTVSEFLSVGYFKDLTPCFALHSHFSRSVTEVLLELFQEEQELL